MGVCNCLYPKSGGCAACNPTNQPTWWPLVYPPPPPPRTPPVESGWQCPACKNVMAPFMPYCSFCAQPVKTVTTTGTADES